MRRSRARARLGPVALAAAGLLWTVTPSAAEKVEVEPGRHEGFGRIVFGWPEKVGFEARIDDKTLTIHFDRPLVADPQRILKRLDAYVESAAMDGDSNVTVVLKRPF